MAGLKPIMCVGETDEERVKGITRSVVDQQVKQGLSGVEKIDNVVIAYEPVWAIGTGKVATSAQAQNVHAFIRGILKDLYGSTANDIRILYGGQHNQDNIGDLIAMEDIDGALVGGASLKADGFLGIIQKHFREENNFINDYFFAGKIYLCSKCKERLQIFLPVIFKSSIMDNHSPFNRK